MLILVFPHSNVSQVPGSSTPPVVPSSSRRMLPRPSRLANSTVMVVTSGSLSLHQRIILSELPRTHGVEATAWFLTCPVLRLMPRSVMLPAPRLSSRATSPAARTTDLRISLSTRETMPLSHTVRETRNKRLVVDHGLGCLPLAISAA